VTTSSTSSAASTQAARRGPLVVTAVVSVLLGVLGYFIAVHTRFGQQVDTASVEGRTLDLAVQQAVGRALDTVSITSIAIVTAALMVVAFLRRRPRLAVGIAVLVVGANVTTQVLKDVLERPRFLDGTPSLTSFPSGHATVAMSLALALVLVVPVRLRLPIAVVGLAYAVVVGTAALTSAWHRASDVLGADLVALAWAAAVAAWLVAPTAGAGARRDRERAPRQLAVQTLDMVVVIATVVVLVAMLAMSVKLVRDVRMSEFNVGFPYVASVIAIVFGAAAAVAALLGALGRATLDPVE
jgi:membrane-associated phospholipid phosphatase